MSKAFEKSTRPKMVMSLDFRAFVQVYCMCTREVDVLWPLWQPERVLDKFWNSQ